MSNSKSKHLSGWPRKVCSRLRDKLEVDDATENAKIKVVLNLR